MFIDDDTRKRLIDIVKGTILERAEDNCTTARNLLCTSFRTSTTVKKDFEGQSRIKAEQAQFLRHHSSLKKWWVNDLPDENSFLTRGGEAKIYFAPDRRNVLKINDGIYYATWLEFFNSVVIHNLLFIDTAYTFLVGRKNYLFAGSHEAAQRSAMLYSLLGTCKLHDINPFDWLREVLEKIGQHHVNKLRESLPAIAQTHLT